MNKLIVSFNKLLFGSNDWSARYSKYYIGVSSQVIFSFALLSLLIFAVSPLNGEDFGLSALDNGDNFVERTIWIFDRVIHQWENWNSRLGEALSIIFLNSAEWVQILIFIVFSCSFIHLLSTKLSNNNFSLNALSYINTLTVIYIAWPKLEVFFWRTTFAGYLIPYVIVIYIFKKAHEKDKLNLTYCLYCILAGMSFENVGLAMVITFLVFGIFVYREKKARFILISAFTFFGWLILMMSPSTGVRQAYYQSVYGKIESFSQIIERIRDVIFIFFSSSYLLFFLSVISIIIIVIKKSWLEKSTVMIGFAGFLSCGAVVLSPYTEPRAFMLLWIFMVLIAVKALSMTCIKINITALIFGFVFAIQAFQSYYLFSSPMNERNRMITALRGTDQCKNGIIINEIKTPPNPRILNNREYWVINAKDQMTAYYRCKII